MGFWCNGERITEDTWDKPALALPVKQERHVWKDTWRNKSLDSVWRSWRPVVKFMNRKSKRRRCLENLLCVENFLQKKNSLSLSISCLFVLKSKLNSGFFDDLFPGFFRDATSQPKFQNLLKHLTELPLILGLVGKKWSYVYRGADNSSARPGRKQARKHVRDARDFNNIEAWAFITFFFSCKARRRMKFTPFWQKHYLASFLVGLRTYQHTCRCMKEMP